MPKVPDDMGMGGSGIQDLELMLNALVDDITTLRTTVAELRTKYNDHIANGEHAVATAVNAAAPTVAALGAQSLTKD